MRQSCIAQVRIHRHIRASGTTVVDIFECKKTLNSILFIKMKKGLASYKRELLRAHERIAGLFARSETRALSLAYLSCLLSDCERKNGWQLAKCMGEATPYAVQHLLDRARWDVDEVRDRLRGYVVSEFASHNAVLIFDETGFLKKGVRSAGVERQHNLAAGRIENCQIGVFLCYAGDNGAGLVDRELYLPSEWVADGPRCRDAGVPEGAGFASKPELARRMIERALDAGSPAGWVAGNEAYGNDSSLRQWLEERPMAYVLAVVPDQRLRKWLEERRVFAIEQGQGALAWERISAGLGNKGPRLYDWALAPVSQTEGWSNGLLVRRSINKEPKYAYYRFYAPTRKITLDSLVRVVVQRWKIEQALKAAKGECGLDQYEVRHWQGWYRHVTLAMLAYSVLAIERAREEQNSRRAAVAHQSGVAPTAS